MSPFKHITSFSAVLQDPAAVGFISHNVWVSLVIRKPVGNPSIPVLLIHPDSDPQQQAGHPCGLSIGPDSLVSLAYTAATATSHCALKLTFIPPCWGPPPPPQATADGEGASASSHGHGQLPSLRTVCMTVDRSKDPNVACVSSVFQQHWGDGSQVVVSHAAASTEGTSSSSAVAEDDGNEQEDEAAAEEESKINPRKGLLPSIGPYVSVYFPPFCLYDELPSQ